MRHTPSTAKPHALLLATFCLALAAPAPVAARAADRPNRFGSAPRGGREADRRPRSADELGARTGLKRDLRRFLRRPPSELGRQVAKTRERLAAIDGAISAAKREHFLDDASGGADGREKLREILRPLEDKQDALTAEYLELLQRNERLEGTTVIGSFDFSLLSAPSLFDAGFKLGGRASGRGTGRPPLQPTPEFIVDTAAGVYTNITWDPDQKRIKPSYTVGAGPVAATTYNPLYGKRLQLIIPGVFKLGISRSCIGGSLKVGLPVGPRVGSTLFVEHPRLMPLNNWLFDKVESAAKLAHRIPGLEQGLYELQRGFTRAKAKVTSQVRRRKRAFDARRE